MLVAHVADDAAEFILEVFKERVQNLCGDVRLVIIKKKIIRILLISAP